MAAAPGQVPPEVQRLQRLFEVPGNNLCADCGATEPRWASWNLGIFICVRCAGIHRSLGTQISKVRSVNLDLWSPEQIQSMEDNGNEKVNAIYLANLPADYVRPNGDDPAAMQAWIRAKYEKRQWVKDKPADVAPEPEPEFMSVTVTDPLDEYDPPGSTKGRHTTYQINVTTNMGDFGGKNKFSVRRRYNDFYTLYKVLNELAKTKFTRLPPMPPKTGLGDDRFSPAIKEARRAAFEKILQTAADNRILRRSDILRQFLTVGVDRRASSSSIAAG